MASGKFFYLRLTGENMNFEEINSLLNFESFTCGKKGDNGEAKITNSKKEIIYEDYWQAQVNSFENIKIDKFVSEIINKLIDRKEILKKLRNKYKVKANFVFYSNKYLQSIKMTNKNVKKLALLDMEINFTIMHHNN